MGTWSEPLFATSEPIGNYVIDIADFSKNQLDTWRHSAFFCDDSKTIYTLSEFMTTGCDTHKLMNHMSNGVIQIWIDLFVYLHKKYPGLESLKFHFFCSDSQEPYYFTWFPAEPLILYMCVSSSQNMFCFMLPTAESERECEFNPDMYAKNWHKMDYAWKDLGVSDCFSFISFNP